MPSCSGKFNKSEFCKATCGLFFVPRRLTKTCKDKKKRTKEGRKEEDRINSPSFLATIGYIVCDQLGGVL